MLARKRGRSSLTGAGLGLVMDPAKLQQDRVFVLTHLEPCFQETLFERRWRVPSVKLELPCIVFVFVVLGNFPFELPLSTKIATAAGIASRRR